MHALTAALQDNVAGSELYAPPYWRALRVGRKCNEDALRSERDIGNPRQVFPAAKQVYTMQFHPGQARLEIPSMGKNKIDACFPNSRLEIIWFKMGRAAAVAHPLSPFACD